MNPFNFESLMNDPKDLTGFAAANGLVYTSHPRNHPYPSLKGSLFTAKYNKYDDKEVMRHDQLTSTNGIVPFEVGFFDYRNHVTGAYRLRYAFSYLRIALPVKLPRIGIDGHRSTFEIAKAYAMKNFPWYPASKLPAGVQAKYDSDYQQLIDEALPWQLLTSLSETGRPFSVEVIDNELYVYIYDSLRPEVIRLLFDAVRQLDIQRLVDLSERLTRTVQEPYTTNESLAQFVPVRKAYVARSIFWRVILPISIIIILTVLMIVR